MSNPNKEALQESNQILDTTIRYSDLFIVKDLRSHFASIKAMTYNLMELGILFDYVKNIGNDRLELLMRDLTPEERAFCEPILRRLIRATRDYQIEYLLSHASLISPTEKDILAEKSGERWDSHLSWEEEMDLIHQKEKDEIEEMMEEDARNSSISHLSEMEDLV